MIKHIAYFQNALAASMMANNGSKCLYYKIGKI